MFWEVISSWICFYVSSAYRKMLCTDYLKIYELYLDYVFQYSQCRGLFQRFCACSSINGLGYSTRITSIMAEGFAFMWWSIDLLKTLWPVSYFDLWMDYFFRHLSSTTQLLSDNRKVSHITLSEECNCFSKESLCNSPFGSFLRNSQLLNIIPGFVSPSASFKCLWPNTPITKLLLQNKMLFILPNDMLLLEKTCTISRETPRYYSPCGYNSLQGCRLV